MENKKIDKAKKVNKDGYPSYPVAEDMYNKCKEEKKLAEKESSTDLDVPGAELDDEQEFIGSEDEENNYYSLGGDSHNYLDETQE